MGTGSAAYLLLFVPVFGLCFAAGGTLRRFADVSRLRLYLLCAFSVLFYAWGETPLCFYVTAVLSLFVCTAVWFVLRQGHFKKMLLLPVAMAVLFLLVTRISAFGFFPLGGAFLALRMLSLAADAYRGRIAEETSFAALFAYLWFFPTFTAGPVVLAKDFLPQLGELRLPDAGTLCDSLYWAAKGGVKRLLLAPICMTAYDVLMADSAAPWLAAICWVLALYHDFSGCSDVARGISGICGLEVGENFCHPMTALSLRDFWRRWHRSLGRFLVEYVYIPLGGNRRGICRTLLAVAAVWAVSGLWHGVGIQYAAFGLYFALFVCIEHLLWQKCSGFIKKSAVVPFRWAMTQILAIIGLAFLSPHGVNLVVSLFSGGKAPIPAALYPYVLLMMVSAAGVFPIAGILSGWIRKAAAESGELTRYHILRRSVMTALTVLYVVLTLAAFAASGHAPALYENLAAGVGVL